MGRLAIFQTAWKLRQQDRGDFGGAQVAPRPDPREATSASSGDSVWVVDEHLSSRHQLTPALLKPARAFLGEAPSKTTTS